MVRPCPGRERHFRLRRAPFGYPQGATPDRVLCVRSPTPRFAANASHREESSPPEADRAQPRSPMQFSDHADCDGALFFKHAAELGLEGIVSKRARSLYRGVSSKNWLNTKNMVEGEFVLLGTEVDDSGIPWALLAPEQHGVLEFAGPAILRPPSRVRAEWADKLAANRH